MKFTRLRTFGLGLSFVAAALVVPLACAPDSGLPPPANTGSGGASSGTATGAGGDGGDILFVDVGLTCKDPTDKDKDLISDFLELVDKDTDGDGTPDSLDDDSDGDGVLDKDEAANPLLEFQTPGQMRDDPCDPLADTDGDGDPDVRDLDSDNDGVSDQQEATYDPDGAKGCRVRVDCDNDKIIDLVELAAGSSPVESGSQPADAGLYFVLPYQGGPQTKDFSFSTGVAKADIYFLIDTTASMQPSIDNLKASIDTQIIPTILNGDPAAVPPIPAIDEAWIGVGTVRDVPWLPYGQMGDDPYQYRFNVGGQTVAGDVAPPVYDAQTQTYKAPDPTKKILNALTAGGGGDAPEATTQALWLAAKNDTFTLTIGGIWNPGTPYACALPEGFGVPCFRPQSLPIFVLITDAAFHNGPNPVNQYDSAKVGGTVKTYADAVDALNSIGAKIVGVPVAGGSPGAARSDLTDLAIKTGSIYQGSFGTKNPLVPTSDVATGNVSKEVVRLLGLLAGAGLHDVTTSRKTYDCAGSVDCTEDGQPDGEFHNPVLAPETTPYDASKLITLVETVESSTTPLPYASRTESTFFGVQGNAPVTFRVHAENKTIKPTTLLVMRALIRVQTPSGQILGGKSGIKLVYFVLPQYIPKVN